MTINYKNIINRVIADTALDKDVVENIVDCMLLELAHEIAANKTVELPYIGDIRVINNKILFNKFQKKLIEKGGFYAVNFISGKERPIKGSSGTSNGGSDIIE